MTEDELYALRAGTRVVVSNPDAAPRWPLGTVFTLDVDRTGAGPRFALWRTPDGGFDQLVSVWAEDVEPLD